MKILAFMALLSISASTIGANSASDAVGGTGNELMQLCDQKQADTESDSGTSLWDMCISYIEGVTDGIEYGHQTVTHRMLNTPSSDADSISNYTALLLKLEFAYCIPNNVTRNQTALVVSKYLADNPDKLNYSSAELVVAALHRAWPCAAHKKNSK